MRDFKTLYSLKSSYSKYYVIPIHHSSFL